MIVTNQQPFSHAYPIQLKANLRYLLNKGFDDPGSDALCLDHFPEVFDRSSRGMREDGEITMSSDHCRGKPASCQKPLAVLKR